MIIATSFGVSNWPVAVDRKFSMSPRLVPRPGLPSAFSAPRRLNEFKIDTRTKVGLRVTKLIMRGEWKRRDAEDAERGEIADAFVGATNALEKF